MILDVIIVVVILAVWLSIREMPIIMASTSSSVAINKAYIPVILVAAILPALLFSSDIVVNINDAANLNNPLTVLIVCIASAISVWIISFFTKWTSILYALVGALFALNIYLDANNSFSFFWKSSISWLLSPLLSFIFSLTLFQLIKYIVKKTSLHLITLNRILRVLLVISLILVLFSFAINNGSLILAMTSGMDPLLLFNIAGGSLQGDFLKWILFLLLILILYFYPVKGMANKISMKLFDINTETSVVIMMSVAFVMLIFSSNGICSFFGLLATPVSPVHACLCAIIGIGWVQNSVAVDKKELLKSFLSVVALPGLSFLLTYSIFSIIDLQKNASSENFGLSGGQMSFDITTFALAVSLSILAIIAVYFYISKNRASEHAKLKIAEDRNQLNEMQKALVDLEIKVIQSENNSLHKRLEIKKKDLINNALWIGQQRDFLEQLSTDIQALKRSDSLEDIKSKVLAIERKILDKKAFSHEMNELYSQVEILHKDYSVILHERFPGLTEQERRLATLLRLGFSTKELSSIMSITPKSVEVCRYRLRKRLNLKREENLIEFIKSL